MAAASSAVATPGAQRTPTAAGRDPTFAAPHANAARAKAAARITYLHKLRCAGCSLSTPLVLLTVTPTLPLVTTTTTD